MKTGRSNAGSVSRLSSVKPSDIKEEFGSESFVYHNGETWEAIDQNIGVMTSNGNWFEPYPLSGFEPLDYYNWTFLSADGSETYVASVQIECVSSKY